MLGQAMRKTLHFTKAADRSKKREKMEREKEKKLGSKERK